MKLIVCLMMVLFQSVASEIGGKKEALRSVASILEVDKAKGVYREELKNLDLYPKINWSNFNRFEDSKYHQFVKNLLPYLLSKVKNRDISTQEKQFSKLLKSSDKFSTIINTSESEKAIYSFLVEKLRIEKELKECANIKSLYHGQEPLMRTQLERIDQSDDQFLIKQLSDITKRIQYITIDSNG